MKGSNSRFMSISLKNDDAMHLYDGWKSPMVIISDGPYGVNGYKGDLKTPKGLAEWYEPHVIKWAEKATPQTTLWFWNTEVGWATVHPVLEKHGWRYVACNIWNKGKSHVAGNVNTKTIRHFPIVSEVCVQYVREPVFLLNGTDLSMQEWLRSEWRRTGLPFADANKACGVKNAATRKYLTGDHLWYMPPVDVFEKLVAYANEKGKEDGKPYFSMDSVSPIKGSQWECLRNKFHCPFGVTNVWDTPQLRDKERVKVGNKAVHLNQKPLALIDQIILASSDEGDLVWDPFGGLFSVAISSYYLKRDCYSTEINPNVYVYGIERFRNITGIDLS